MIRIIKPEDLIEISKLENICFVSPYPPILFNQYYEQYRNGFFVAEEKGRVVGYAMNDPNEKEIMSIAVYPEFRKKGIGSELLKKSLEYFRKRGVKKIKIHVRVSNKEAQSFYKHHGFVQKGLIKNYYGNEDGILMEKSL